MPSVQELIERARAEEVESLWRLSAAVDRRKRVDIETIRADAVRAKHAAEWLEGVAVEFRPAPLQTTITVEGETREEAVGLDAPASGSEELVAGTAPDAVPIESTTDGGAQAVPAGVAGAESESVAAGRPSRAPKPSAQSGRRKPGKRAGARSDRPKKSASRSNASRPLAETETLRDRVVSTVEAIEKEPFNLNDVYVIIRRELGESVSKATVGRFLVDLAARGVLRREKEPGMPGGRNAYRRVVPVVVADPER